MRKAIRPAKAASKSVEEEKSDEAEFLEEALGEDEEPGGFVEVPFEAPPEVDEPLLSSTTQDALT